MPNCITFFINLMGYCGPLNYLKNNKAIIDKLKFSGLLMQFSINIKN